MTRWTWLLRRQPPVPIFPMLAMLAIAVFVLGLIVRSGFAHGDDPASPGTFRANLETTKGAIVVDVVRDWAPHGADRFYRLVQARYYDDNRFFRVVKGQWAQFGINGDPKVAREWRGRAIPDDTPRQSNVRRAVTFAFSVP